MSGAMDHSTGRDRSNHAQLAVNLVELRLQCILLLREGSYALLSFELSMDFLDMECCKGFDSL